MADSGQQIASGGEIDLESVLNEKFGMPGFRQGQAEVISRLMAGKSVAAVFPTGGGKSLCYQLPSQVLEGTTLVVSPLIALMKDQCDALEARGIRAARLDSTLAPEQLREMMSAVRSGAIKILYVAPERFFNERFLASIESVDVALFAIDEAHCISQWGHNFRPDYLKLAVAAKNLNVQRVLALTATATPGVLQDIQDAFDIADSDAIRTPFYRQNLQLRSTLVDSRTHDDELIKRLADRPRGSTLVYVSLQRTATEVAECLTAAGYPATTYHAGLDAELRHQIQQDFIESEDGIVVATIAFGMGIDKSNIRYVYHYNPPKSLESYAQEIGRAGRDGEDSVCEILLMPGDRTVLENFVYGDTPSLNSVNRMIELVIGQPETFYVSHYKVSAESDVRILVVRTLLTYLELDGYIKATSPRYDSYKVKPFVTSETILSHFGPEKREFVSGILSTLTKGRTWFTLNMVQATKKLGGDRQRIVKAIDYMVDKGWLEVKVADLVHGYRWLKRIEQPETLANDLYNRLVTREASEVGRLDEVFELVQGKSCQANQLSAHFGEIRDQPCGRCSFCLGEGGFDIPSNSARSIGTSALSAVNTLAKSYPAQLSTARDKARFLCGLSSPSFVKARLSREANFGVCDGVPFATVLGQMNDES